MELNPDAVSSREQLAQFVEALRQRTGDNPDAMGDRDARDLPGRLCHRYIDDVPGYSGMSDLHESPRKRQVG